MTHKSEQSKTSSAHFCPVTRKHTQKCMSHVFCRLHYNGSPASQAKVFISDPWYSDFKLLHALVGVTGLFGAKE